MLYTREISFKIFSLFSGNMTIDIVSDVKLYEKDDLTFFNVTSAHVKYNIGGLKLRMNNLFDGIDSLGKKLMTCALGLLIITPFLIFLFI